MTPQHLHLILTHVPIVGVALAAVLLATASWLGNRQLERICLALLVVFAVIAIPVYLTGEPAEKAVEHLPGVLEATIDRHENAAGVAFIAMEALGVLALFGLVGFARSSALPRLAVGVVFVLMLGVTGLFGWTAYLGGQIRHTEISAGRTLSDTASDDAAGAASPQEREKRQRGDDD